MTDVPALQKLLEGQIAGKDFFTEDQKQDALVELANLYLTDQTEYDKRLKQQQPFFGDGVRKASIETEVLKIVREMNPKALSGPQMEPVDELVWIARKEGKQLWHDPQRETYSTFERDGHLEHHRIDREDFRDWLNDKWGERHQIEIDGEMVPTWPKSGDVQEALYHIKNYAKRGSILKPDLRVLEHQGDLWIDTGSPDWSGYRVTADGWERDPQLRAPLIRADGMEELPFAVKDGDIRDLREFCNLREEDFVLFVGDLAATLNPFGNKLTTLMHGPSGSAKTTATRLHRKFTDPMSPPTCRAASPRDLMHSVLNSYVVAFENVSDISAEMSDNICALNTGTGYKERKYYAQGVEFKVNVKRPVLINGIPPDLAEREDLLSRSITFAFDHLGDRVRSEDMFWRKLDVVAPRVMGAILDGLVGAMRMRRDFNGDNDEAFVKLVGGPRPRFVDAVVWAEAFCRTVGFEPGEFTAAYRNNQLMPFRILAETDPICIGIAKLIARVGHWQGYPAELHAALRPYAPTVPEASWLSRRLPHAIPVLLQVHQIKVVMNKRLEQDDNKNGIIIDKVGVGRGTHFQNLPEPEVLKIKTPFRRRI